ncbi:MAG: TlpA family protein disulfide reductase [Janthinobacterium lividum]
MSGFQKVVPVVLLLLPTASVSAQLLPVETPAPAFTTRTMAGQPLSLQGLRGKVVLLDYWATWCSTCHQTTPILESLHNRFGKQGLAVVGMSADDRHSIAAVKPFVKQFGMTYTITIDPAENGRAQYAYHVDTLPAQYLIDKRGIIRWSHTGYSSTEKQQLAPLIKRLLAER